MIYLLLSILLSSTLFICFKWFDTRNIQMLPAISGNYIACIICGLLSGENINLSPSDFIILFNCLLLGALFFLIFYAMGYVSSKIGVGISSASAKMSLIIPVLFGAIYMHEPLGLMRICALILALLAVALMSVKQDEKWKLKTLWIPLIIFFGSGIIDTWLNILQKKLIQTSPASAIVIIFSSALICSLITFMILKKSIIKESRSIMYGLVLGIPNYFSVYFLIMALGSGDFTSGQFYLINNSGIMLLSFLLAWLLFSEKITRLKGIGLMLSLVSIYLILFG